jgi:hypothetical protein
LALCSPNGRRLSHAASIVKFPCRSVWFASYKRGQHCRADLVIVDGQNWTLDLIDGEDETDLAVGPQSASTLAEAKRMAQEWEAEFY